MTNITQHTSMPELETDRLRLRQWQESDLRPFAQLNADPDVMRHFPKTLSRAESDDTARLCKEFIEEYGWGFWAAELKSSGEFIGFVGLLDQPNRYAFSPCVEIGWRLARAHWGRGLATEAAKHALDFAFSTLSLDSVVSFTTVCNIRSQAVMTRLGMTDTQQNFHHPEIASSEPLSEHVLYRIERMQWQGLA